MWEGLPKNSQIHAHNTFLLEALEVDRLSKRFVWIFIFFLFTGLVTPYISLEIWGVFLALDVLTGSDKFTAGHGGFTAVCGIIELYRALCEPIFSWK